MGTSRGSRCTAILGLVMGLLGAGGGCGDSTGSAPPMAPRLSATVDAPPQEPSAPNLAGDAGAMRAAESAPPATADTCLTVTEEGTLSEVNLVVVLDRSGSMGDTSEDASFDPKARWIPVGDALKGFFSDSASAGVRASLTYFPDVKTNLSCSATDYSTPAVPPTPLPSRVLGESIDQTFPRGDTPTREAMRGAIAQAEALVKATPDARTAIVLATDGEPVGCGVPWDDASARAAAIAAVAADVAAISKSIPTYVIGVGGSLSPLDAIAQAGGTGAAMHVTVGAPAQTSQDLLSSLSRIRGTMLACDFPIPAPKDGRALDYDRVSVTFTPESGAQTKLAYDAECSSSQGFRFDNPASPKRVVLCDETCKDVRTRGAGALQVHFTCQTQQIVHPK